MGFKNMLHKMGKYGMIQMENFKHISIKLVEKSWKIYCTELWNVLVAKRNGSKPVLYPMMNATNAFCTSNYLDLHLSYKQKITPKPEEFSYSL